MQPNLKNSSTSTVPKGGVTPGCVCLYEIGSLITIARVYTLDLIRVLTEHEPLLRLLRQYFPKLKGNLGSTLSHLVESDMSIPNRQYCSQG
jgi:hypothetical protein